MTQWYSDFETPLASTFPDARCPYAWLDPVAQGPDPEVLDTYEKPWKFSDFKEEWDHPDLTQFAAWYEERGRQGKEIVSGSEGKENKYGVGMQSTSTTGKAEESKPAPLQSALRSLPTPARAVPSFQSRNHAYTSWSQSKESLCLASHCTANAIC